MIDKYIRIIDLGYFLGWGFVIMDPCTWLNHPDVILIARDFLDQGIDRIKTRDNFKAFFRRGLARISLTSTSCKQKETEEQ